MAALAAVPGGVVDFDQEVVGVVRRVAREFGWSMVPRRRHRRILAFEMRLLGFGPGASEAEFIV